jgi:hypothetical protein
MPIRNMWSLECGEVLTAEALTEKFKGEGIEIYFPLRDIGADLLAVKGKNHVFIQVKESRYFKHRKIKDTIGHSFHQVDKSKLDKNNVDFYVFLTYLPQDGENKLESFKKQFLIVPTKNLRGLAGHKKSGKKGVYSFYFHFDGKKVFDKRDGLTDYSEFLESWNLIRDALDLTA